MGSFIVTRLLCMFMCNITMSLLQLLFQMFVDIAKMDGALTTCIAISFLFNALVDVKLLHEGTFSTLWVQIPVLVSVLVLVLMFYTCRIIMLCTYVWVFYAYFLDVVSPM